MAASVLEWPAEYARIRALRSQSPPGPQTSTDVELMERIKASDPAALAELYDRHNGLVFGVVLRMLRNRDEAEEVLQDTFVQAWRRGGTYQRDLGSPAGWLVGIARNRAIDRLRAGAVRFAAHESAAAESGAADLQGPAPRGEQHIDIRRALAALPLDERNLIEQAYFQGFTHSELAERHGIPLGTIKTRIRRGVQTLREHLKGRYIES